MRARLFHKQTSTQSSNSTLKNLSSLFEKKVQTVLRDARRSPTSKALLKTHLELLQHFGWQLAINELEEQTAAPSSCPERVKILKLKPAQVFSGTVAESAEQFSATFGKETTTLKR